MRTLSSSTVLVTTAASPPREGGTGSACAQAMAGTHSEIRNSERNMKLSVPGASCCQGARRWCQRLCRAGPATWRLSAWGEPRDNPPMQDTPPPAPVLLLVDGSSYLYRAYHALPDLRGPEGVPTGAIHGVVNMMTWLREHIAAEHAVCVFDAKGPTFRDAWYPEYKAQRAPMPDDLRQQIEPIHEAVRLLGWPVLEVPGIEADDAIGTLARVAAASGHRVVISTGDKDLAQLVTDQVSLINTMAKPPETLDVAGVQAKFGVPPERIIDYLTLIGDTVDNVPGVEKVGPKTAVKWLAEHGTLEGVMAAADSIKGVAGENLRKALDWLPTGRKLITVVTDHDLSPQVPNWPSLDALALREPDREGLLDFYTRFGFRTGKRELEAQLGRSSAPPLRCSASPGAAPATCSAR